jgi:ADP-heptose:LPS heptosyltransferase
MRITVASPDGLGDFILRLPLFEALLAAGHSLQMVMRPPAADFAKVLFPGAEILVLDSCPFSSETKKLRHPFRRELGEIRRFEPDLYIASAFQLNFFEEVFAEEAPDIRIAGFRAEEDFWPSDTSKDPHEMAAGFAIAVSVPTAMPEVEKSRRLAEALVGAPCDHAVARPPSVEAREAACRLLGQHGLAAQKFTVVCAGSRPGLLKKDWGEANWEALFREIGPEAQAPFIFFGNPKESASVERLRAALPASVRSVNLASEPPALDVSYALLTMAYSYIGRDSGVMHMAALAGIPLLAVFAGGHWPRFLPEAARGIVLTREAPCRGCNFHCPFPEPWCVKTVPVDAVVRAWRELPGIDTLRVVELPSGDQWLSMARELDVPAYAREQSAAARAAIVDLRNESAWKKLFAGLTSR